MILLDRGLVKNISWSIQANAGGCEQFRQCPMSPVQVLQVGKAMCDTNKGLFLAFVTYREELLAPDMLSTIEELKNYCSG